MISGRVTITSKFNRNQVPPIPNNFEVMVTVPEILTQMIF
jgi:hypothetical protein